MNMVFLDIKDKLESLKNLGQLQGQHRVMWKHDGVCYGTSWTMSIGAITEDDIYEMDEDKPEVEAFMALKNIKYMTIAQPKYIALCARKNKTVEVALDDMAQIIGGPVTVASYEKDSILQALSRVPAVLVSDMEMAITLGRDLYESFAAMTVLEKASEVCYKAPAIGGVKPLSALQIRALRSDFLKGYSKIRVRHRASEDASNQSEGVTQNQSAQVSFDQREETLRKEIIECGKALVAEGLIQGTWGNISARLDKDYMLVTPSGLPYDVLTPSDIVKVRLSNLEFDVRGNLPTSESFLHRNIYRSRSDVRAVVHTHSKGCSIFAAAGMPLEIKRDGSPEELIRCTKYAQAGTKKIAELAAINLMDKRGVFLSNHGMVAVGDSVRAAMENAKEIEKAAMDTVDERRSTFDMEVYIG